MYTGDDFNYAELIAGDDQGYSDALLGIFDAIAPAAAAALVALSKNDGETFHDILGPTVPLSRHIFRQPHTVLQNRCRVHGLSQRPSGPLQRWWVVRKARASTLHLAEIFRLADAAGLLRDPALAVERMRAVLKVRGVCKLMRDLSKDHQWLSINTATVRNQADFIGIVEACAKRGIRAVSPWRDQVAHVGLDRAVKAVRDAGLQLSGYCRGGSVDLRCCA